MASADNVKRRLRSDRRGAVLVEFLVAVMPLMITFSSALQLSHIVTARLVVRHGAVVGARAAAVISNKNNNTPDAKPGDNTQEIEDGVRVALGPWAKTLTRLAVTVDDQSSCEDQYGVVKVTVDAAYRCSVPFGARIVCKNAEHPIKKTYAFPHQGARYKEGGGASCETKGKTGTFTGGGGDFSGGGASGNWND